MKHLLTIIALMLSCLAVFSQTSPSPQNIPYSQDFSGLAHSSTTYPSGWNGWQVTTTLGSAFNTAAPTADKALTASSSASSTAGNVHNYNGKIGCLNSGSSGDLSLVLAVSTTGKSNIKVLYDVMTIRNPYDGASNTRINEVTLQYRIGSSGSFTTLSGIEYQNNTTLQTTSGSTSPQNSSTKSITLPSQCDNQSVVELRWISRQVSGAGSRPSFAIDNVSVEVTNAKTVSIAALTNADEASASDPGTYKVSFSEATTQVTTLDYSFTGTAAFGSDYKVVPDTSLNPDTLTSENGTITVPAGISEFLISITALDDNAPEGTESVNLSIANPSDNYLVSTSTASIGVADDDPTFIHDIQGSGSTATAGSYLIEAIVTGVYPGLSPAGFYVQEEDADKDANAATSEGIFIVSNVSVSVGDKVRVSGTAQENSASPSFGQAVMHSTTVKIISNGNTLPARTTINLPFSSLSEPENYECMLVYFPGELTVTDNYNLGRFGEIDLSAGALVYQPTQVIDVNDSIAAGNRSSGSSNLAAVNALALANALRTILLDDGTGTMTSLPFADTTDNNLRIGSKTSNLSGIMGYGFSSYRVQPIPGAWPRFAYAARPSMPSVGSHNLKVSSFNVLNYFNGNGKGAGFPTSRGAHSLAEFNRQRDKIILAIAAINADVVGLTEIENDGTDSNSAIADLVNGLNKLKGAGTYDYIRDGANIQKFGTDAIRCAIIYQPAKVKPQGSVIIGSDPVFNRPPVSQRFTLLSTCSDFNYIINHFKSKSATDASGADLDMGDGQGAYNDKRKKQSTALTKFVNDSVIYLTGCKRVISMGDYNAYFEEDPLDLLRDSGYKVLGSATSYSYQFSGQIGSLDHALVNSAMLPYVSGVAKWNLNAAEPTHLGYEDNINDGSGDFVNQWSATYTKIPYRSSDHDAVIVGVKFPSEMPVLALDLIPSNNTFTGGVASNIYLGYGPQSDTIKVRAIKGKGFSYSWTPAGELSCDTCSKTVFAPEAPGIYEFTVIAVSDKGCKVEKSVKFCVKDVRVPRKSGKVYICHNGRTNEIAVSAVPSHLKNHDDDFLGKCDDNTCRERRDNDGCGKRSEELSLADSASAAMFAEINLYPNPASSVLNVALPSGMEGSVITLMEISGRVILKENAAETVHQVSISEIPQGVYVLNIEYNGSVYRRLIVKQ